MPPRAGAYTDTDSQPIAYSGAIPVELHAGWYNAWVCVLQEQARQFELLRLPWFLDANELQAVMIARGNHMHSYQRLIATLMAK